MTGGNIGFGDRHGIVNVLDVQPFILQSTFKSFVMLLIDRLGQCGGDHGPVLDLVQLGIKPGTDSLAGDGAFQRFCAGKDYEDVLTINPALGFGDF